MLLNGFLFLTHILDSNHFIHHLVLSTGSDGCHLLRPEELPTHSGAQAHRELLPGSEARQEASLYLPVETPDHQSSHWRLTKNHTTQSACSGGGGGLAVHTSLTSQGTPTVVLIPRPPLHPCDLSCPAPAIILLVRAHQLPLVSLLGQEKMDGGGQKKLVWVFGRRISGCVWIGVCESVCVCVVQPLLRLRQWKCSSRHRCCDWLSFRLLHACPSACPVVRLLVLFVLFPSRWWALYYRSCCQIKPVPTAHAPQYCPAAVKCLFSKSIINMKMKHFCHKCLFGFGTDGAQGILGNVKCWCFG